jgi:hypothetical protein
LAPVKYDLHKRFNSVKVPIQVCKENTSLKRKIVYL